MSRRTDALLIQRQDFHSLSWYRKLGSFAHSIVGEGAIVTDFVGEPVGFSLGILLAELLGELLGKLLGEVDGSDEG